MRNFAKSLLTMTCVLVLSCTYADRRGTGNDGPEIIVKFSDRHAMAGIVVRAIDDAVVAETLSRDVATLSAELGVPFVYSRLTSGREIIVELQVEQTLRIIADRCRESVQIDEVHVDDEKKVVVINIDSDPGGDLSRFLARTVNDDRLPTTGTMRGDGRVEVAPDFDSIARILADELSSRPDVDYAQINYRVRHYDEG